jgi:formylglycine-generating enzyme required for sulfatase activity
MAEQPIEVFFSYSREDKPLRDKLEKHLVSLKRQGVISLWHDREIVAGSEWEEEIDRHLKTADIILLLVSPDFVASKYCYEVELPDAIARHEAAEAYVVPILLRPTAGWKNLSFAKLQVYPSGGKAVTLWGNEDEAYVDVAEGIAIAVAQLLEGREQKRREQERQEQERLKREREQEQRRIAEIRRQEAEAAEREEQAKRAEQAKRTEAARVAEQARQAEQAQRQEAERRAERQRQERIREEQRQAAAQARMAEESRREREAELHRQAIAAQRSHFIDNPAPQTDPNRRQFLKWAGYGGGAFALAVAGQQIWGNGRSTSSQSASTSSQPVTRPQPLSVSASITDLKTFDFEVATVNAKGQENPRQAKQAKAFVEDLGNGTTLELVQIPGGTFQMGSPESEKYRDDDESPQHSVTVPAFLMGRYAVTQAQYESVMGSNPSRFNGANRPVEQVSWNEAQAFCKKLSQQTGRTYRLPSEAEWEYACRAGTTTPFHFGETITSALANYDGNFTYQSEPKGQYRKQTIEVGSFPANAFGLCDMHGNVWEWCEDVYHKNYVDAPTDGKAWNVGGEQDRRLLRGGSWVNFPGYCRSSHQSIAW